MSRECICHVLYIYVGHYFLLPLLHNYYDNNYYVELQLYGQLAFSMHIK